MDVWDVDSYAAAVEWAGLRVRAALGDGRITLTELQTPRGSVVLAVPGAWTQDGALREALRLAYVFRNHYTAQFEKMVGAEPYRDLGYFRAAEIWETWEALYIALRGLAGPELPVIWDQMRKEVLLGV